MKAKVNKITYLSHEPNDQLALPFFFDSSESSRLTDLYFTFVYESFGLA
jgi:hypothetical protein